MLLDGFLPVDPWHFPDVTGGWFWSSGADLPDDAWSVDFDSGSVDGSSKDYAEYVRLVRGGQ